jgi:hypothetical protein
MPLLIARTPLTNGVMTVLLLVIRSPLMWYSPGNSWIETVSLLSALTISPVSVLIVPGKL